jgi:hypothetical protein
MTVDVVYTSYRKDLNWLCYSMQLLHKHLRGAFGVQVIVNRDCKDVTDTWGLPRTQYHFVDPWPDGYAFAMAQKASADKYSDADLILLMDSDHILLEPLHIDDLLEKGVPIIRYRNWDEDPNDTDLTVGLKVWGPPTERVMGVKLDKNYMIAPPFAFWHDTFPKLRARIEQVVGLPFEKAVFSDVPFDYRKFMKHPKVFCDYESLGLYAAKFQPGRYALVHQPRGTYWPLRVYWSHGDWNAALQAKFDALLAA